MQFRPLHSELARLSSENERLKHELSLVKQENLDMQMLMVPNSQTGASRSKLSNKVEESSMHFLRFETLLRTLDIGQVDL
jgi:hypothetical protein